LIEEIAGRQADDDETDKGNNKQHDDGVKHTPYDKRTHGIFSYHCECRVDKFNNFCLLTPIAHKRFAPFSQGGRVFRES
jgi:hypothetical protein